MSKHTPAPWLIADNSKTFVYALNEKGTNVFFAHVQDAHTNKEELEANARLIAAAPELLEALQHLFNSYKSLADSGDAGNWKIEDQPEGIKALAAIRNATGE